MQGLRLTRLGLATGAATIKSDGLIPGIIDLRLFRHRHSLRLLPGDLEDGAYHAGVRTATRHQGAEKRRQDMGHFAQKSTSYFGRLRRSKLQHHRKMIGQLRGAELQAGPLIGLQQVDERRATVARIAMHMLKQVGLTLHEAEDMYQIMAIANYEDRFVIPTTHREYAENAFDIRGGCGFSFGNGCSDGASDVSLFGGKKPRTIPIKATV